VASGKLTVGRADRIIRGRSARVLEIRSMSDAIKQNSSRFENASTQSNGPAYFLWMLFVFCHVLALHPALDVIGDFVLPFSKVLPLLRNDTVAYVCWFVPWYAFWALPYWIAYKLPIFVTGFRRRSLLAILIPLHLAMLFTFPRVWILILEVTGVSDMRLPPRYGVLC